VVHSTPEMVPFTPNFDVNLVQGHCHCELYLRILCAK